MREIDRAAPGIVQRHRTDVLIVFFGFVVARDVAFAVGINDVPVARIGNYEPALAAAGLIPILAADHSRIRAARNANIRVVLLRAVNVIRKRVVDCDMIKLRGRLVVLSGPAFSAVDRDAGAAVVRIANPIRILRIDPETVVIPVSRRKQIKRLPAVDRSERARV